MAQILFVDDDPTIGAILHDTLLRMGHQPHGAANIPEALGVLQHTSLDLIILDHRMPGMTGLEFLEYLREEGSDSLRRPDPVAVGVGSRCGRSVAAGCRRRHAPGDRLDDI